MTTIPTYSNPFFALSLTDRPLLEDYIEPFSGNGNREVEWNEEALQTPFNLALLREHQVAANQVVELADLISERGLPDFPIVFCGLSNARGMVYLEGEIPWPLVLIDVRRMNTHDALREIYLHEAAHLESNGNDHDFRFAAINTLFRSYAGYPQSQNEYDYRFCDYDNLTLSEAKSLSSAIAQYAVKQHVPVSHAKHAILELINSNLHAEADSQTIVEKFKEVLAVCPVR